MFGREGAESVDGGDGNDTLLGGEGGDSLFGGAGNDRLRGDLSDASEDPDEVAAGNDSIDGGSGDDRILGERGNDTLAGGDGEDRVIGGLGNDRLSGGGSNDDLMTMAGNDRAWGGAGNDDLIDGLGNDTLYGGDGIDDLIGAQGNDTLYGGDGIDVFQFGAVITYLLPSSFDSFSFGAFGTGATGSDTSPGIDIIADFEVGTDFVRLLQNQPFGFAGLDTDKDGRLDTDDDLVSVRNFTLDGRTAKSLVIDIDDLRGAPAGLTEEVIVFGIGNAVLTAADFGEGDIFEG
jgi:Ca2+-binding RTX toxin-like protein